jgi:hypothetical protein
MEILEQLPISITTFTVSAVIALAVVAFAKSQGWLAPPPPKPARKRINNQAGNAQRIDQRRSDQ